MALPVLCTSSLEEVKRTRHNLQRLENLIYAFAVAVVILSIGLVAALVWGNDPAKVISGMTAIGSGGGMLYVRRRRNEASTAHAQAQSDMKAACGPPAGDAEAAEAGNRLTAEEVDLIASI